MKLNHKYCFLFIIFSGASGLSAQNDSAIRLGLTGFMQLVKQNHPLVKQADLIIKSADANKLMAHGGFDPKIFYEFRNKNYDNTNYYKLSDGGFTIPTWFGIELKGGYEQNSGQYLNPENNLPKNGLFYSQISFPLLQGLIIDERRAVLKQAKIFRELSEYEKINTINELLYKAGKTYWDWHLSYTNLQVHQNAVALSKERFEGVKKTTAFGDRPAIDTIEADIQLQDRIINLQQALMDYRTKSLLLSNFLWLENNIPIELSGKTVPEIYIGNDDETTAIYENTAVVDSIINAHPSLQVYDFKLKQLTIEQKFKRDKLKPTLNLNYNPLYDQANLNTSYMNNYKLGLAIGFPLFLRKERGDLHLTKIKIENTTLETINKRNELINKTKAMINEFNNYKNQIDIYAKNVSNYEKLWQSEKELFNSGESSLFMINSREMSYINAQVKLNELINKKKKADLDIDYSFGQLNSIY